MVRRYESRANKKDSENKELCTFLTHHKMPNVSVIFLTFKMRKLCIRSLHFFFFFFTCFFLYCQCVSNGHFLNISQWSAPWTEPWCHQSWLPWGSLRSFIKTSRLTFQILSFCYDILLLIHFAEAENHYSTLNAFLYSYIYLTKK